MPSGSAGPPRYRLAPQALRDMKEITAAARTKQSEEHAVVLSMAFQRAFENLAAFPHLGPSIAPGDQRRTIMVRDGWKVLYRSGPVLLVLRVFDARRDMQRVLDRWPRR